MATINPVWSNVVTGRADAALAASEVVTVDIDLATLGADVAEVQIRAVVGASSGIDVEILPDIGGTFDTLPAAGINLDSNANVTLPISGAARRVQITNLDASNATGLVGVYYRHRSWQST